jgi:hypothetical protein
MTDSQRIEAMFEEGRLTREQADQLLQALSGFGETPEAGEESQAAAPAAAAHVAATPAATANAAAAHAAETPAAAASDPARDAPRDPAAAQDGKWLDLKLLAGNVRVEVDPDITEPQSSGDFRLERTETGMRIDQWPQRSGQNIIDSILNGARMTDLDLRLPAGWSLRLDLKAGNVTIRGPLRQLAGRVQAGDVDVEEVHAIDLQLSAGNVRTGLRLQDGQHRISSSAGNLNAKLLPGSNVLVDGSVRIGSIKAMAPLTHEQRGLGAVTSGHLGANGPHDPARLELRLATGDLKIGQQNA